MTLVVTPPALASWVDVLKSSHTVPTTQRSRRARQSRIARAFRLKVRPGAAQGLYQNGDRLPDRRRDSGDHGNS